MDRRYQWGDAHGHAHGIASFLFCCRLSFSTGPTGCIGFKFALTEMSASSSLPYPSFPFSSSSAFVPSSNTAPSPLYPHPTPTPPPPPKKPMITELVLSTLLPLFLFKPSQTPVEWHLSLTQAPHVAKEDGSRVTGLPLIVQVIEE